MNWLEEHLRGLSLDETGEAYLYGRGTTDQQIEEMGIVSWSPHANFGKHIKGFGDCGEHIKGWVVHPFRSFRQEVIGFEGRNPATKQFVKLVLPGYEWSPLCLGNTTTMLQKLWNGADLYLVEGVYDLTALAWAMGDSVVLSTVTARLSVGLARYLVRLCRGHIYLCYDNDAPGIRGADKAMFTFSDLGWDRVSKVKYGLKDPGEVWNQGGASNVIRMFGGNL